MEVIPSRSGGSGSMPFQRHNVKEWSRLDSLTGMLEHARVEAGHWAANTSNSSQQYGKVVDSRARNLVDGSVQQRQRKQLEVFQAQVPGGSLQVIRTQSVTSTSSSSCSWRTPLHSDTNAPTDFENIPLPINPLDLSSQKTKASVGRSGSIGSRRPPSRPRSIISKVDSAISEENLLPNAEVQDVDKRLSEVSRVCQQIHEETKRKMSNSRPSAVLSSSLNLPTLNDNMLIRTDDINRRGCTDGNIYGFKSDSQNSLNTFDICADKVRKANETVSNGLVHAIITRKKSCSTEDLQNNDHNEKDRLSEGNEISADLIRTLGVRRSLQLPNKGNRSDIPNGNVSKLCKDLEDRKSLDTMKNHATSFDSFENIFKYGTESARNASLLSENNRQVCSINSLTDKSRNGYELEGFSRRVDSTKVSSHKRHSFVTVESLKEVRGRLRHLSTSPLDDIQLPNNTKCQTKDVEDGDDGIVTEDFSKAAPGMNLRSTEEIPTSCVKSYVYGMEAVANNQSNIRKSTAGTGSLESRASNRSSSSGGSRSEEWYNRRKSYGFEQVHNQQAHDHSEPVTLKEKSRVESSTDSGICRSSETVIPSSWTPFYREKANDQATPGNLNANHSIEIKPYSDERRIIDIDNRGNESNSQKGRRTVVTLGSDNGDCRSGLHVKGRNILETSSIAMSNNWRSGCESRAMNSMSTNTSAKSVHRLSEPVTVTIPVVCDDSFSSIDRSGIAARKLYFNQLSERTSLSTENGCRKSGTLLTSGKDSPQKNLSDEPKKTLAARRELLLKHSGGSGWSPASRQTDGEIKRHSIAVDETKYVREGLKNYNLYEKRKGHFNFESGLKTISTNIPDVEKSTGLNLSNKEDAMPFQKELEYKISTSEGMPQDGSDFKSASFTFENDDGEEFLLQHHLAGKKHKKVEFCKTEVHFAAEPGRFNIVETDEKPPPNNIRRRRRSNSGAVVVTPQLQDASKTCLPEIRFGDSLYEKKLLGGTECNSTSYQIAVSVDTQNKSNLDQLKPIMPASNSSSCFQDDADKEDNIFTQSNATIISSGKQDTVEMGAHSNDEDVSSDSIFLPSNSMISSSPSSVRPRSILKNNKKPRPFHLGETDEDMLVSSLNEKSERSTGDPEAKWGVRLKPVQNRESSLSSTAMWKSTVSLHNPTFDGQKQQDYPSLLTLQDERLPSSQSFGEGTELNKPLKTLQPAFQRKSTGDAFEAPLVSKTQPPEPVGGGMEVKISMAPPWSVAERVRQVEDLKRAALETRGYSTKVNFGAGETTVLESRSSDELQKQSTPASPKYQPNNRPKPIWLRREERKQEAVQHCDHADISPIFKLDNSKEPSCQRSVTEAKLQSYNDSNRLCAVETLVSTRSGHPKITSISLRYEGEQSTEPLSQVYDRNPDCDLYQASFHSLPSSSKGNLHITESKHPIDFGVNTPFTATSSKSFNKPLFTQQKMNSDSSKSVFTQKQKDLSSSFVESPFQPERQTSKFTTDERNYNNLKPRSQTGKNSDSFGTDQTLSLLGRKVLHPEIEDKFMFYHNHKKHEFSPKCCSKQELEPTVSSDNRISNNRMSLSPVSNKTLHKDQKNMKFPVSVPTSGSSNSSDLIRSRRSSGKDMKKERLSAREEETKKECHFYTGALSSEKHKHLERTFICESEKETQCNEREKRANKLKSASSISIKHDRSLSPSDMLHSQTDSSSMKMVTSPVYENLKMVAAEPTKKSNGQNLITDTVETESAILEELTRAADQILQAVNGYTDEESYRASSDEPDDEILKDGRRRRVNRCGQVQRPSASLGTITEAPSSKKQQETGNSTSELHSHKSNNSARKSQRLTKTRPCPTSSTSSVESFIRENSRVQTRPLLKQEGSGGVGECNRGKVASSSISSTAIKSSSRTARLLQRASSRELLLQTYASSSEDVASGVEVGSNRKPVVPRRTRTHNSSNSKTDPTKTNLKKSTVSSDSQLSSSAKARPRKRDADINKPKERFPGSPNKMVPLVRKSSGGDSGSPNGGRLHTSRSRDEDRHRRASSRPSAKRDNTDLRHRTQGGNATTVEPSGRDRGERTIVYERRVMGTMGGTGRSSASCVVTKKKPSLASSHNKGLVQIKGSK